MRSAIWKLSALATVVGLGLVAVVVQQKGLGFGAAAGKGTAEAKAPAAPGLNAPKGGAKPEANEATSDPFAADPSTDDPNAAPPQLAEVTEAETSDPALQPATVTTDEADHADFAAQTTKPRIKPRALNFKDNVENGVDNGDPADVLVAEAAAAGAGRRNRIPPAEGARSPGGDPAEMEGSTVDQQDSNSITDEADPFQKHREALARQGTRSRSGGSYQGVQGADPSGPSAENPFDQNAGTSEDAEPVVPVPSNRRTRPRARLIDENDPAATEPAVSEVVSDAAGYQRTAAPAGYRAEAAAAGSRSTGNRGATRTRPQIGDDESFKADTETGTGATPPPVEVPGVPAGKAAGLGKRPQTLADEDAIGASPNVSALPDGVETIPKISRDGSEGASPSLTPAISNSGRARPNPLAEDGEEGLTPSTSNTRTRGNAFDAQGMSPRGQSAGTDESDSAFSLGKSRRSSPHVLEIEPDRRPALPGTPEAAASRSMETAIVPVPVSGRVSAAPTNAATGATNTGRGMVTIEKRAPATAYVGQPLVYQIFVRNVGSGPAQQVVVEDIVPAGVTMQGSIPQGELTGRKLAWRVGTLAAGEERKISVKVIPGAAGSIGSAATVKFVADQVYASADGAEADSIIPTATTPRTTSRTTPRSGGVLLDLQAPRQVGLGQTFEVRFRLTNRTGQSLNDLLVRSMLPGNLQHESRVQDLEYRVGTLAAGESREVPLTLTAGQAGRADTRVMVMAANDEVLRTDDFSLDVSAGAASASLPTAGSELAGTPQLAVDVVPPAGPIPVGGRVSYEIRLINRGSAPVRQAALRLGIPSELSLVNAGPLKYRQEGADVVFDAIPVLQAGQQAVVKVEFTAQAAGETYLNVQFVGAHMKRPLSREEGLTIGR